MFKKMIYLLVAVVICGAIFMGWKLTSRSAYESAEYTVLETDGQIELRSYPDLMLVTTTMGTRYQGDDGSFGRLFQYISGCLLYTSPSPRDRTRSRMPSSA